MFELKLIQLRICEFCAVNNFWKIIIKFESGNLTIIENLN